MENERPIKKRKTARKAVDSATPRRITRGMTTDAARRAVFDTTELLENIISFLPSADILTKAQRVSRAWNTLIKTSHFMQTKLWLKPRDEHALQPSHWWPEEGVPGWGPGLYGMPIYPRPVELNPRLTQYPHCDTLIDLQLPSQSVDHLLVRHLGFPIRVTHEGLFPIESGQSSIGSIETWKRIQLSHPPISIVLLTVFPPKGGVVKLIVRDNNGITLGHLADVLFLASFPSDEQRNLKKKTLMKQSGFLRAAFEEPKA